MATAKNAPEQHVDDTLGGALPDPNDTSLHGQLQSGAITYKEWVHQSTAPPETP